jgi:hypothetical protein
VDKLRKNNKCCEKEINRNKRKLQICSSYKIVAIIFKLEIVDAVDWLSSKESCDKLVLYQSPSLTPLPSLSLSLYHYPTLSLNLYFHHTKR